MIYQYAFTGRESIVPGDLLAGILKANGQIRNEAWDVYAHKAHLRFICDPQQDDERLWRLDYWLNSVLEQGLAPSAIHIELDTSRLDWNF